MGVPGRLEIDVSAVIGDASVSSYPTANRTKWMFSGGRLILPQFPGWYVPEPVVWEPVVRLGVATPTVIQGDRFYGFSAKVEAYRAGEVQRVLDLLSNVATLRDYCYLGGGGTLAADGQGIQYKLRTGRLIISPPQSPAIRGGRVSYFEPMEFQFEET